MRFINKSKRLFVWIMLISLLTNIFNPTPLITKAIAASPTMQTNAANNVTTSSATLSGKGLTNGGAVITYWGFRWGTDPSNLTKAEEYGTLATGVTFSKTISNLQAGTTYYYQAFGANSDGSGYGNMMSFRTQEIPIPTNIPVSSVSLNRTSLTLNQNGSSSTLVATVSPSNATNKSITWSTDRQAVATVDSNGVVTPHEPGTAHITAMAQDGSGKYATATVTVVDSTIPVTSISLNRTSLTLNQNGSSSTLVATVSPSNATNKSITWSTDRQAVATVDSNGVVTPHEPGTAHITAMAQDGSGKYATATVTVVDSTIPVTGISLNRTSLTLNQNGSSSTLVATVSPGNATNKSITWSTDRQAVATVDSNGVVTPHEPGTAHITAMAQDGSGKYATATVTVVDSTIPVTGISLNRTSLTLNQNGSSSTLVATVSPSNATNKSITWSTDRQAVATVDSNGVVTPHEAGTAHITAMAQDGSGKYATATVTVVNSTIPVTGISLNRTSLTLNQNGSSSTLVATVSPGNATNKSITWSTDRQAVATVDSNGVVTPHEAGTAHITAMAQDGSGKYATATVTVVASTDTKAPIVTITDPVNGVSYRPGTAINISANATDDAKVSRMAIYINNNMVKEDSSSSLSYSWNTSTISAGTYTIKVNAMDTNGNVGTKSITVTVANPTGEAPTLSGLPTKDEVTEGEKYVFKGTISAKTNLTKVNILANGISVASAVPDSTSFELNNLSVDTSTASLSQPGTYTILVWAKSVDYPSSTQPLGKMTLVVKPKLAGEAPTLSGLPTTDEVVQGQKYTFKGTISAKTNLTKVNILANGNSIASTLPSGTSFDLNNFTVDTSTGGLSQPGTYTISVWAKSVDYPSPTQPLGKMTLVVKGNHDTQKQTPPNNNASPILKLILPQDVGNGKGVSGSGLDGKYELKARVTPVGKVEHVYYYLVDNAGVQHTIGVGKNAANQWSVTFDTKKYANGDYELAVSARINGKVIHGNSATIVINSLSEVVDNSGRIIKVPPKTVAVNGPVELILPKEFGNGNELQGEYILKTRTAMTKVQHVYYYLVDDKGKEHEIGVSKDSGNQWAIKFDTFKYDNGNYKLSVVAKVNKERIPGNSADITIADKWLVKLVLPDDFGKKNSLITDYILTAKAKPVIDKVHYYLVKDGEYYGDIGASEDKTKQWPVDFRTNKFENGTYELAVVGMTGGNKSYGNSVTITFNNIYTYDGKHSKIGIRTVYNHDAMKLLEQGRLYVSDREGRIYKKRIKNEMFDDVALGVTFEFKPNSVFIAGSPDDSGQQGKLFINSASGNEYFSQIPEEIIEYDEKINEQNIILDVVTNALKSKKIDNDRKNKIEEIARERIEAYTQAKKGIFNERFIKDKNRTFIAKKGDRGNNVKEIQTILFNLGYQTQNTKGIYDVVTFKNVAYYQTVFKNPLLDLLKIKGPDVTGYVDADTYNSLWGDKLYKIDPKTRAKSLGLLVKESLKSSLENYTVTLDGQEYRIVKMHRDWLKSRPEIKVKEANDQWIFLDSNWHLVDNPTILIRLERMRFANTLLSVQRVNRVPEGLKELIKLNSNDLMHYQAAMNIKEICQGLSVNLVMMSVTGGVQAAGGVANAATLVAGNTAKDFARDKLKDPKIIADVIVQTLINGLEKDAVDELLKFHSRRERITNEDDAVRYVDLSGWAYAVTHTIQLQRKLDGREELATQGYGITKYVEELFQKALFTALKNEDQKVLGELSKKKGIVSKIVGQLFDSESDFYKILNAWFRDVPSINTYLKEVDELRDWVYRGLNPTASEIYTMRLIQTR